ncbi:MAG: hypothetical protein ACRCUT_10245 [Spirochaetota bacterium]
MLLSIDRVLQLLAEGKDISKICDLSGANPEDVSAVIEEARVLLSKHDKEKSRKKVIIKKKVHTPAEIDRINSEGAAADDSLPSFLDGAELSAVPVEDLLVINIAAVERGSVCGISIIIHDKEDRQVGKLSYYLRRIPARYALIRASIRAYEIAAYFRAREVRIRSNDDIFVRQINGEIYIQEDDLQKQYDSFHTAAKKGPSSYRCEIIPTLHNDKATYLAEKAIPAWA